MNRERIAILVFLGCCAIAALTVFAHAKRSARRHLEQREELVSQQLRRGPVSDAVLVGGLVAAAEARDGEEVARLLPRIRATVPADVVEEREEAVSSLVAWCDELVARQPLDGPTLILLCRALEHFGAAERAEGYRREWRLRMADLHADAEAAVDAAADIAAISGSIDDGGRLAALARTHRELVTESRRRDLDPGDDPEVAAALDAIEDAVWEHAHDLLGPFAAALGRLEDADASRRIAAIRRVHREHPELRKPLGRCVDVLEQIGWRSDDDHPRSRLLALATSADALGPGTIFVLLICLLVPLVALVLATREVLLGPGPIDPSAETLENVDPLDLDTEGVTVTGTGGLTTGSGTRPAVTRE